MSDCLELEHGSPDAVPRARRFAVGRLAGSPAAELADEVALVTSELVTNAVMHGLPPVRLAVSVEPQRVRIEVTDGSGVSPLRAVASPDGMTGRGLALVGALASRWGAEPTDGGKLVWAEIDRVPVGTAPRADEAPFGWDGPLQRSDARRYTVELGDVPTDLLVASKAHVDNLVREFALVAAGAASGHSAAVPAHVARLIETVTTRFAEARHEIKRQAVVAASTGAPRTRLTLTLPLDAADAGEAYLHALDEADGYARAARLLTLETPPQHQAFRRWYVGTLVRQLRAMAAGEDPEPAQPFESYLLGELDAVTAARRSAERSARLQSVTASLAGATDPEAVAAAVVAEAMAAVGAVAGGLLLPDGDRLTVAGAVGYSADLLSGLSGLTVAAPLPAATALRTAVPVWLESREECDTRFPALRALEPAAVALCAVPLVVGARVVGVLRFGFDSPQIFDADARRFLVALAAQTAHALDRSAAYAAERAARATAEDVVRRLHRLQRVTAALTTAGTAAEIARVVVREALGTLGAVFAGVAVLDEDGDELVMLEMYGSEPGDERRWARFPVADDVPAGVAVRTRTPVVVRTPEELTARFPRLTLLAGQRRPLVCVPLCVGPGCLGVLSMTFPPGTEVDDGEVDLLVTIGQQCAIGLERTALLAAERAAARRTAFLARATEVLTSSLEPTETLRNLTSLIVPALADWAVVHLADDSGAFYPTATAHRDPDVGVRMARLSEGTPLRLEEPGGLAEVVRTGRSLRYAQVPEPVTARSVRDIDDPELAAALRPATGIGVPLVARGRILGTVAIARVDGPPYAEADLALVEDIAARAAVAVANAREYDRERAAALTLQRSLLPQRLPRVPGVTFAWRYLPGTAGTEIGGDWYDVIPLDGGHVVLVIGDVMGRGLQAAAVMGQLRATTRAAAVVERRPAAVLARLDAAVGSLEQAQITTAAVGVLHLQSRTLRIASAGHLPPLLLGEAGGDYLPVEPGPPLGAGLPQYDELEITLPRRATVLLYTDGLVEDRGVSLEHGLAALREAAHAASGPEDLCERALAVRRSLHADDDTALLAVALGN